MAKTVVTTTTKKGTYKRKPYVPKVSKALKKIVKSEIQKVAEKKTAYFQDTIDLSSYANTLNRTVINIPITPWAERSVQIYTGASQGDRIGNSIKVVKAMFRGIIHPNPINTTYNNQAKPQDVKFIFYTDRANTDESPETLPNFFQSGSLSNEPNGTLKDLIHPVNKDRYLYRGSRTYKIGTANYSGYNNQPEWSFFANNDYKFNQMFSIDVTDMVPTHIRYDDSEETPTSYPVFCFCQCVNADGTAQDAFQLPLEMTYSLEYVYIDV